MHDQTAGPQASLRRSESEWALCGTPAHGNIGYSMKRVLQAPNLVLATLWADMLSSAGFAATVQRAWAGSIAGELPPDQCLPEVWVQDSSRCEEARQLLNSWQHGPHRKWVCGHCSETVEGPFDECWNCGTAMPPHAG